MNTALSPRSSQIWFVGQTLCRYPGIHVAVLVFLALSPALLFSFGYHNDFWAWAYPAETCCSGHPESAITMATGRWFSAWMLNIQFISINSLEDLWSWRLVNIGTTAMFAMYYLSIVSRQVDVKISAYPFRDFWLTVGIFTLPTMQLHAIWASNFTYFMPPLFLALFAADAGLRATVAVSQRDLGGWSAAATLAVLAALFFYPPSATFILVPVAHRLMFRGGTNERRYALLSALFLSAGYVGFFAINRFILLPRLESLPSMGDYHFIFNESLVREALNRFSYYVYEAAFLWSAYELAWIPYLVTAMFLGGFWIAARQPVALIWKELFGNFALVVCLFVLACVPMLVAYKFSTSFRVMFTGTALLLVAGWRLTLAQLQHTAKIQGLVASSALVICFVGVYGVSQLAASEYKKHASALSGLDKDAFHAIAFIHPEEKKRFLDLKLRGDFGKVYPISTTGDQLIGPRYKGHAHFDVAELKVSETANSIILEKNTVVVDNRASAVRGGGIPLVELMAGTVHAEPRGHSGPMNAVDGSPYSFWEVWGSTYPINLELVLNTPKALKGYRMTAYEATERMPTSWELWVSLDLKHWQLLEQRHTDKPWVAREIREFQLPEITTARGLRLVVNGSAAGAGVRLYEFTLLPAFK